MTGSPLCEEEYGHGETSARDKLTLVNKYLRHRITEKGNQKNLWGFCFVY